MRYQVLIRNEENEEIELFASDNKIQAEGALEGAKAMLELMKDEFELEEDESYKILFKEDDNQSFGKGNSFDSYFS